MGRRGVVAGVVRVATVAVAWLSVAEAAAVMAMGNAVAAAAASYATQVIDWLRLGVGGGLDAYRRLVVIWGHF